MAHLVFAMSSWNPGGTYDLPLLSVLSDSWTIQKKPDAAKFFHLSCGIFFFRRFYFGLTSSGRSKQQLEKQHAVANRRTRCQIKVFVGVWPVIRVGVASGGALEGARAHRRGALSRTQGVRHRGVVA